MSRIKNRCILSGIVFISIIILSLSSNTSGVSTSVVNKQERIESDVVSAPYAVAPFEGILDVTTDKLIYHLGEIVTIILTNIGNDTLSAGGPIINIYDGGGKLVYSEACYCWQIIEPGESITWTWDQTDQSGNQVPPNIYIVEGILSGGGEVYSGSSMFHIVVYSLKIHL